MGASISPICPICRRYVQALVRGTPFEAAAQAEGFCTHSQRERAVAQRAEDAAHDSTVLHQQGRAVPGAALTDDGRLAKPPAGGPLPPPKGEPL